MQAFAGTNADGVKTVRDASASARAPALTAASRLVLRLACLVLAAALLFGGAARQSLVSDAIPEIAALPLLAVALPHAWPGLRKMPGALALVACAVALPCAQLIPLPPFAWTSLPGRDIVVDIIAALGAPPSWRPISLIPSATWRSVLSLLPAVAVFIAVIGLDRISRGRLLSLTVAIGAASLLVALLQVIEGQDSALYFFNVANVSKGVGFFANSNHFGAFLVALPPLSAVTLAQVGPRRLPLTIALIAGAATAMLLGLSLSGSRAAVVLGILSAATTLPLLLRVEAPPLGRARFVASIVIVSLALPLLVAQFGMRHVLTRFSAVDIAEDARWTVAAGALSGAADTFPFGAGVGTFPGVYPLHERVVDIIPQFVNRAHDDALETVFEGGAMAGGLALGFVVWLWRATSRALSSEATPECRQARAGALVMWLLLLHSLADYPLRTIALETLFALCAALQFAPPPPSRDHPPFRWPRLRRRRPSRRRVRPTLAPIGSEDSARPDVN